MSSQHEPSSNHGGGNDNGTSSLNSGAGSDTGSAGGVKGQISELAQTAKSQASAAIQPLTNNARSMAEEQKQRGAQRVDEIAQAIHNAASEIEKEVPFAAGYVHAAGERLESVATTLRESSVEDLAQMATEYAQERPLMFVGGAVAVGFALARLFRSSAAGLDTQ